MTQPVVALAGKTIQCKTGDNERGFSLLNRLLCAAVGCPGLLVTLRRSGPSNLSITWLAGLFGVHHENAYNV